jgi:hypothetical protein
MAFWHKLWRRDEDLDEEIRAHLSMAAQDRVARGELLADATRAARREFGNELLIKEVTRDMWGWTLLEQFVQDLRYALRGMINNRVFTLLVALSLALGIGAKAAMTILLP